MKTLSELINDLEKDIIEAAKIGEVDLRAEDTNLEAIRDFMQIIEMKRQTELMAELIDSVSYLANTIEHSNI